MNSRNIYIIRHGQTDYNKNGVVQGSGIDASLNETGRSQAASFYQAYHHLTLDAVYVSGLKRTKQTIQGFITNGRAFNALPGLNEINWGKYEGQPVFRDSQDYYNDIVRKWSQGKTYLPIDGGESPDEVQERIKASLEIILKDEKHKNILICMHGRALRILLSTLLSYPLPVMDIFPHHNTGLYHLLQTKNMIRVIKFNDYHHLNGSF